MLGVEKESTGGIITLFEKTDLSLKMKQFLNMNVENAVIHISLSHNGINIRFISVIKQLDAQNFCFTISLVHAPTCFEHMYSKHVEA